MLCRNKTRINSIAHPSNVSHTIRGTPASGLLQTREGEGGF